MNSSNKCKLAKFYNTLPDGICNLNLLEQILSKSLTSNFLLREARKKKLDSGVWYYIAKRQRRQNFIIDNESRNPNFIQSYHDQDEQICLLDAQLFSFLLL
jgi:protoporphyrinogen oxidase